jgi:ABC-2 type transport system permease protein
MSIRRTGAMLGKELRHILRDPRSLIMALVLPIFLMLLFGYALNLDLDRIPTMIHDADHSQDSRELVQAFQGSRFFEVRGVVDSAEDIERAIDRDQAILGIVIPQDYSRKLAAGSRVDVQILADGSDSNTASIALGYAETVIQTFGFQLRTRNQEQRAGFTPALPVEPRIRVWYNDTLESKNFVVPGLIAVILMVIASLPTALTIAREWEMGTMEQLLSTPLRPAEMILGKMGAYFVVGAIDTAMSVVVSIRVFDVPFRGDMFLLAATSGVFLCGAMGWGLLLSSVAKSQFMAFQMGMVSSFLPAFLLSGFIYLIDNMPVAIQVITRLTPARYFVTLVRAIFQKGVGLEILWPELLFLAAFSLVVFVLSTLAMKRRMS